jgi:hypothetical protein
VATQGGEEFSLKRAETVLHGPLRLQADVMVPVLEEDQSYVRIEQGGESADYLER